jgi:hypothetical protein
MARRRKKNQVAVGAATVIPPPLVLTPDGEAQTVQATQRSMTTLGLRAPEWRVDSRESIHVFLLAWRAYQREAAIRVANGEPVRPLRMVECVKHELLESITAHELPKQPEDITDEEFIAFLEKRTQLERRFLKLEDLPPLKLDWKVDIIAGRISKLYADMKRNLRLLDGLHYLEGGKAANKLVTDYLIAALPVEARSVVLDSSLEFRNSHEGLTPDNLFEVMVKGLKDHERFGKKRAAPFDRSDRQENKKKLFVGPYPGRAPVKVNAVQQTTTKIPPRQSGVNLAAQNKCAKCGSEFHKIKNCSAATAKDIEEFYAHFKKVNMISCGMMSSTDSFSIKAILNGNHVSARLDSGADVTVCSLAVYNRIGEPGGNDSKRAKLLLADGITSMDSLKVFVGTIKIPGKAEVVLPVTVLENCSQELLLGVDFFDLAGISFNMGLHQR